MSCTSLRSCSRCPHIRQKLLPATLSAGVPYEVDSVTPGSPAASALTRSKPVTSSPGRGGGALRCAGDGGMAEFVGSVSLTLSQGRVHAGGHEAPPHRHRHLPRAAAPRRRRARSRSSPAPPGPPPLWAGPAATASTLVSTDGRSRCGPTAAWACAPRRCPTRPQPIDTLVLAGGDGAQPARRDDALGVVDRGGGPPLPPGGHGVHGRLRGGRGGVARRSSGHDPLGPGRAARHRVPLASWSTPIPSTSETASSGRSAGVTAGIDLALALVHDDLGVEVAQTVARQLVMFLHRTGGQTQFASPVWVPRAERSTVRAVQSLVEAAPGGDHRLPTLAAAAAMSVRHFARVFTRRGGRDPGPIRRTGASGSGPARARDHRRHPRRRGARAVVSARPRPCAGSSSGASASPPTSTGGASASSPTKGHRHERHRAPHPVHRTPCHRPHAVTIPLSRASPRSTPWGPTRCCSASPPSTSPSSATGAARSGPRTACWA